MARATKGNLSISSRLSSPCPCCSCPLRMRAAVTVETPIPAGHRQPRTDSPAAPGSTARSTQTPHIPGYCRPSLSHHPVYPIAQFIVATDSLQAQFIVQPVYPSSQSIPAAISMAKPVYHRTHFIATPKFLQIQFIPARSLSQHSVVLQTKFIPAATLLQSQFIPAPNLWQNQFT